MLNPRKMMRILYRPRYMKKTQSHIITITFLQQTFHQLILFQQDRYGCTDFTNLFKSCLWSPFLLNLLAEYRFEKVIYSCKNDIVGKDHIVQHKGKNMPSHYLAPSKYPQPLVGGIFR